MRYSRPRHRRGSRQGQAAQGLVEFALVGGLFFFLIFSIVNGAFFLYGRGAIEHAADVGVATLAAEGNCNGGPNCLLSNADQVAISRMGAAGLTTTALFTVTEIDIYRETQNANGTLSDDTTCNSTTNPPFASPDTGGTTLCENRYMTNGAQIGGSLPWPPSARNVTQGSSDFARLVVTYRYSLLVTSGSFTLSTDNVFRLEPQVLVPTS